MLRPGIRIKIIDAGCGATACNGYTGIVVNEVAESMEAQGLPEDEPHIKVLLDKGVYKKGKELWRVNTPENGLYFEINNVLKKNRNYQML